MNNILKRKKWFICLYTEAIYMYMTISVFNKSIGSSERFQDHWSSGLLTLGTRMNRLANAVLTCANTRCCE